MKELPKHKLPVTVGVHHNQLSTDPMLRRNPIAPWGSPSVESPSTCHLSHHGQSSLLP